MMEKIIEKGGHSLHGIVHVGGAKNAILPIQAAALLAQTGTVLIHNVDPLADVTMMNKLLNFLNLKAVYQDHSLHLPSTTQVATEAPFQYVEKMRASLLVLGPLLARTGRANVALPGGCSIGTRPIDLHIKGLRAMGATINEADGRIEAHADHLQGARIYLDFHSVGATEDLMLAATMASGITVIDNAAREPEIVDLANVLNKMGAQVHEAGTATIRIQGVSYMHGCEHTVIPDRIVTGTYLLAGAATAGDVLIKGAIPQHNASLMAKLEEMGATVVNQRDGIRVIGTNVVLPSRLKTLPYPGFPTDLQPAMAVLLLKAHGTSTINETVFPSRFGYLEELRRMNAQYQVSNGTAVLQGPTEFSGAEVTAPDVRGGAALVLAGLVANGITQINNVAQIDRGYYHMVEKLQALGAEIQRSDVADTTTMRVDDLKRLSRNETKNHHKD